MEGATTPAQAVAERRARHNGVTEEPVRSRPGETPQKDDTAPDQIEAVKGEVVEDGPSTKTLMWHGADLVLPAELPGTAMFDVTEAQVGGDDTAILKLIYDLIGKEQWAKARAVAGEQKLNSDDFQKLLQKVLAEYGMGPGESSDSAESSSGDGGE